MSTGGEEDDDDEEEGERTGGWGEERGGFQPCDAPFSSAAGRSSVLLADMESRAFSMLSLSARRSENQQSTSVWDSRVSWASRATTAQSSEDQMSHRVEGYLRKWEFILSQGDLNMGSLKTFLLFLSAGTHQSPAAPLS